MSKSSQKRNSYNTEVVNGISAKYGITSYYVRQCLNGSKKGIFPDKISKEYRSIVDAVNNTVTSKLNQ